MIDLAVGRLHLSLAIAPPPDRTPEVPTDSVDRARRTEAAIREVNADRDRNIDRAFLQHGKM